jgi:hypothetical protein
MEIWNMRNRDRNGGQRFMASHAGLVPLLLQWTECSDGLDDLAGANASGAHTQGFPGPVDHRMNAPEIGIPPAPGDVVSVAHPISINRTFAANFAFTRHQKLL